MKEVQSDTIGGRIREARMESGMTITGLAGELNTSSNYLSAVERNVKVPSGPLLHRISEVLDVSFSWLKTGAEGDEDVVERPNSYVEFLPSTEYHVNAALFLKFATEFCMTTGKAGIAKTLQCAEDELNHLLSGEATRGWTSESIAELAEQMDISSALREWARVRDVLQSVQIKQKLRSTLQQYVNNGPSFYKFAGPDSGGQECYRVGKDDELFITVRTLRFESQGFVWSFKYLYLWENITEKEIAAILRQSMADEAAQMTDDRVSLVFTSEALFDTFKEAASGLEEAQHPDELSSPNSFSVDSLLLMDAETWSIKDEAILDKSGSES